MFGISGTELALILFFGFLIFGPDKLPQIGRTVGQAIRQFRETSEQMNKKFKEEVYDPFQEAVAPIKEDLDKKIEPYKEDITDIKGTFDDTKTMISQPFKDVKDQTEEMKKSIDPFASPNSEPDPNEVIRDQAGRLPKQQKEKKVVSLDEAIASSDAAPKTTPKSGSASKNDPESASTSKTAPKSNPAPKSDPAPKSTPKGNSTSKESSSKETLAASLYGLDSKGGE